MPQMRDPACHPSAAARQGDVSQVQRANQAEARGSGDGSRTAPPVLLLLRPPLPPFGPPACRTRRKDIGCSMSSRAAASASSISRAMNCCKTSAPSNGPSRIGPSIAKRARALFAAKCKRSARYGTIMCCGLTMPATTRRARFSRWSISTRAPLSRIVARRHPIPSAVVCEIIAPGSLGLQARTNAASFIGTSSLRILMLARATQGWPASWSSIGDWRNRPRTRPACPAKA